MGFWEDATPATKGIIVIGVLVIVYFAIAYMAGLPPYGSANGPIEQQRGIPSASAAH